MRADLHGGTDAAQLAFYDPAAVAPLLRDADAFGAEELEAAAAEGALLGWYTTADGNYHARVFVDEPPDPELLARAEHRQNDLLLRVPSGQLWFTGAEDLADADVQSSRKGHPSSCKIPRGDYRTDAFEIAWSEEEDERYDAMLKAEVGAFAVRAHMGLWIFQGILVVATLFILLPAGIGMLLRRPHEFKPMFQPIVAVVFVLGFLSRACLRHPALRRVEAARLRLNALRPDVVLWLRRVGEDTPRPEAGGIFGEGYPETP